MIRRWTEEEIAFLQNTDKLLCEKAYNLFQKTFPNSNRSYQAFAVKRSKLNLCNAADKKLYWTKDKIDFIVKHDNGNIQESYELYIKEYAHDPTTLTAFKNQRSRMGIAKEVKHGSTKQRPLYSEHTKKNLVYIKVAQPNCWISKAKWVYQETHPGEIDSTDEYYYVFLNNNNRDFSPDNIYKLKRRVLPILSNIGGFSSNPEETLLRIRQAELKMAMLDLMTKKGMINCYSNSTRVIKKEYKWILGK